MYSLTPCCAGIAIFSGVTGDAVSRSQGERGLASHAVCKRFLGGLRRECLDHFVILNERHVHRLVNEYKAYFNHARPHQGIEQR